MVDDRRLFFAESAETKIHAAGDQTSITCETHLNGGETLLLLGHTLECWHRGREYRIWCCPHFCFGLFSSYYRLPQVLTTKQNFVGMVAIIF